MINNIKDLLEFIEDTIFEAKIDFERSRKCLNSYGHGYDNGFLDCLLMLKDEIINED